MRPSRAPSDRITKQCSGPGARVARTPAADRCVRAPSEKRLITRRQRLVLGFVLAPILGLLVFVISLCTFVGIGAPSGSPTRHVECLAGGTAVYAGGGSLIAYSAMIVFGLPLFWLFWRENWLAWWQVSLGGLLVGLLAGGVLAAVVRTVNAYVLLFGGVGLVSGFVFLSF